MSTPGDGIRQPYCPAQRAARRFGETPFLIMPEESWTFEMFAHRVGCFADHLRRMGVERRDGVALVLPLGPDLLAMLAAVWRMGAIAFPLDPKAPGEHTAARVRELGCRLTILPGTPPDVLDRQVGLDAVIEALHSRRITQARFRHGRLTPAVGIFSSGTGGSPKAALLSLLVLTLAAQRACKRIEIGRGSRYLLSLPVHHVSGLSVFMRCLEVGAQCVLPGLEESTVDAIVRTRPTHLSLVAAQLRRVLDRPDAVEALREATCVLMGGGPLPEPLIDQAVGQGVRLVNSYGMTETAAMICATRLECDPEELRSVGRPMVQDTVRINAQGRIEVRGNVRFVGYLQDGELVKPGTWFDTGDLGHFDDQGRLHIDGRADRMFIVGGENVQPETVEAAICGLAGVRGAVVVPVPDITLDCVAAAFVEVEGPFDKAALLAACQERLPRHAVPRHIFPWPEAGSSEIKPSPEALRRHAENMLRG